MTGPLASPRPDPWLSRNLRPGSGRTAAHLSSPAAELRSACERCSRSHAATGCRRNARRGVDGRGGTAARPTRGRRSTFCLGGRMRRRQRRQQQQQERALGWAGTRRCNSRRWDTLPWQRPAPRTIHISSAGKCAGGCLQAGILLSRRGAEKARQPSAVATGGGPRSSSSSSSCSGAHAAGRPPARPRVWPRALQPTQRIRPQSQPKEREIRADGCVCCGSRVGCLVEPSAGSRVHRGLARALAGRHSFVAGWQVGALCGGVCTSLCRA